MKYQLKKSLSILLAVCLFLSVWAVVPTSAAEVPNNVTGASSGTTGRCIWTLDDQGTLTISGNGRMGKYYTTGPWGTKIRKIKIETGVTSIGDYAFVLCENLENVDIPDSITSIGEYAFFKCKSLESVDIPDSVTNLGYRAFYECTSLANVTIGNGITSIDYETFYGCTSLESVTIPDSVTSIDSRTFHNCTSLATITISDNITFLGGVIFYNTAYYNDDSNWEDGVLYIGKYLIEAKNTISGDYVVKDGTLCIAGWAFYGCKSLLGVTIPDSVNSICTEAFVQCMGLRRAIISENVSSIGSYAFGYYYYDYPDGGFTFKRIIGFVICGYEGSSAERYATEYEIPFEALSKPPTTEAPTTVEPTTAEPTTVEPTTTPSSKLGDIDGNGIITVADATMIQKAGLGIIKADIETADVNGDGRISILDATCVLKYLAGYNKGLGKLAY